MVLEAVMLILRFGREIKQGLRGRTLLQATPGYASNGPRLKSTSWRPRRHFAGADKYRRLLSVGCGRICAAHLETCGPALASLYAHITSCFMSILNDIVIVTTNIPSRLLCAWWFLYHLTIYKLRHTVWPVFTVSSLLYDLGYGRHQEEDGTENVIRYYEVVEIYPLDHGVEGLLATTSSSFTLILTESQATSQVLHGQQPWNNVSLP